MVMNKIKGVCNFPQCPQIPIYIDPGEGHGDNESYRDFDIPSSSAYDFEGGHRGGGRGKRRRARTLSDEQRHPCRVCGKMLSTKW